MKTPGGCGGIHLRGLGLPSGVEGALLSTQRASCGSPVLSLFRLFPLNRYLVSIYYVLREVTGEVGGCSCEQNNCLLSRSLHGGAADSETVGGGGRTLPGRGAEVMGVACKTPLAILRSVR